MAWSKMVVLLPTAVVLLVLAAIPAKARVPKFAIGRDFRAVYAKHHIDAPDEPHDSYRIYIRENTKELLVEPRIQVIPPSTTTDTDDVCEYRILPPVRTTRQPETIGNRTLSSEGDELRGKTTTSGAPDEDYEDDEDDQEDEQEELPFVIRPSKENKHEAIIEATKTLNCEHKTGYEFDIVAVSCAGDVSESARVVVKVEDVNEFEPKFSRSTYEATIEEGRLVESILQVEAFDEDCSEEFSRIARYEISDPKHPPFTIDGKGVIRNTRPLNFSEGQHHFLAIVAYDSAGKKSVYPATVSITVQPVCSPQWKVHPERVDYVPDVSQVKLYRNAQLDLCQSSITALGCNKIDKITGHVTLKNDHIGKGCDREDKLPLQVQRRRCSSKIQPHTSLIELLATFPNSATAPKRDTNNTFHSSNILLFDGQTTAVVIPSQKLNPDMFNRSFTITTWLKRDAPVNRTFDHKYPKEHVLCISDDRERSRHHVALYIRNCRLGLLLRREPKPGDQITVFKPAEWRWNLDNQLCNGEWHHYAVSVKYPDVKLFIDGKEFDDDAETEIIDDWALHPTKGLQTTTVVGACWQGSQKRMDQYLHGYLDGLSVLVNETEEESVVQCMQKCAERLTLPVSSTSAQAVFSMLDSDENEMLVEGYDVRAFQDLINQIGYENDRMYPAPGVRFVDMRTSFTCSKTNSSVTLTKDLPDVRMTLRVAEAVAPTVTLSGPTSLTIDGMDHPSPDVFQSGVKILDSVTISVMRASSPALLAQDQKGSAAPDYESMVKKFEREVVLLDSCTVRLRNERGLEEDVSLNISEIATRPLGMEVLERMVSSFEREWIIKGSGASNEIPEFLGVLRDVRLKLDEKKTNKYGNLQLKVLVSCTELFGKLPSADYTLEVHMKNFEHLEKVVLHKMELPVAVHRSVPKSHLAVHNEHIVPEASLTRKHDLESLYGPRSVFSVPQFHTGSDVGHMTSTGAAITVVVVICVSFFIFLVFVGVVKIRSIHLKSRTHSEPDLQAVNNRKPKSRMSLKSLKKLRKSLGRKKVQCEEHEFDEDDDLDDEDLERGNAGKQKNDMKWDDEGMSITVNPLEEMQGGNSDMEYDEEQTDDDYHRDYEDGEVTDEEKENETHHRHGCVVQDDADSSGECDECSKPNRAGIVAPSSPTIRRSQSCTEAFVKSKDSRMTRSELEWDDQI